MPHDVCHEYPDVPTLETRIVDARPGAAVLERTPFYPGGGGQLPDRGMLRALVFQQFAGALVTGAQMNGDRPLRAGADSQDR